MRTMMAIPVVLAALIVAGTFVVAMAMAKNPPAPGPEGGPVAQANDKFALALYAQLARQKGNVFFSPGSIHTALSMTYAGAGGQTQQQMGSALQWPKAWPQEKVHAAYKAFLTAMKPAADAGYQLTVANALWGQKGFPWRAQFLATTKDNYGAGLKEMDFAADPEAARKTINDWVEEQTKQKIKDLLGPGVLTGDTRLVLTNAVYFKGSWAEPFDKQATQDGPFYPEGGKETQTPLMYRHDRVGYAQAKGLQVLSLPYKGEALSMVVLLPEARDGLGALEKDVVGGKLEGYLAGLQVRKVEVFLPRFKMTSQFSLADALQALGMRDPFDQARADFSGMDGKQDLFISAVVHKAFVDVNEEGTEAAAATGVAISVMAMPTEPDPVFRADHPFLFLIRHNATGAILFMGRLSDPGK